MVARLESLENVGISFENIEMAFAREVSRSFTYKIFENMRRYVRTVLNLLTEKTLNNYTIQYFVLDWIQRFNTAHYNVPYYSNSLISSA